MTVRGGVQCGSAEGDREDVDFIALAPLSGADDCSEDGRVPEIEIFDASKFIQMR